MQSLLILAAVSSAVAGSPASPSTAQTTSSAHSNFYPLESCADGTGELKTERSSPRSIFRDATWRAAAQRLPNISNGGETKSSVLECAELEPWKRQKLSYVFRDWLQQCPTARAKLVAAGAGEEVVLQDPDGQQTHVSWAALNEACRSGTWAELHSWIMKALWWGYRDYVARFGCRVVLPKWFTPQPSTDIPPIGGEQWKVVRGDIQNSTKQEFYFLHALEELLDCEEMLRCGGRRKPRGLSRRPTTEVTLESLHSVPTSDRRRGDESSSPSAAALAKKDELCPFDNHRVAVALFRWLRLTCPAALVKLLVNGYDHEELLKRKMLECWHSDIGAFVRKHNISRDSFNRRMARQECDLAGEKKHLAQLKPKDGEFSPEQTLDILATTILARHAPTADLMKGIAPDITRHGLHSTVVKALAWGMESNVPALRAFVAHNDFETLGTDWLRALFELRSALTARKSCANLLAQLLNFESHLLNGWLWRMDEEGFLVDREMHFWEVAGKRAPSFNFYRISA